MAEKKEKLQLWLIRHGETAWSADGRHTGRTNVPLTDHGREQARRLRDVLAGKQFGLVLTSPLDRAQETCRLAGCGDAMEIEPNLAEWNYGKFEGLTTDEIRGQHKEWREWSVWRGPVPDGETIGQVGERADRVIERALKSNGPVALFAHAHILRILGARWIGMAASGGEHLRLETASISVLGFEREARVISQWNRTTSD